MIVSACYWALLDISISLMLSSASLTLRSRYVFFCCGENKEKRQKQVGYNFRFGNIRRLFLLEHTLLLPKLRDRAVKILCDKIRWYFFGSYSKTVLTWITLWLLRLSKHQPEQSDHFWQTNNVLCAVTDNDGGQKTQLSLIFSFNKQAKVLHARESINGLLHNTCQDV